jgi:Na+-transporting NADH:ubiquinone oxidoreductase subunit A
MIKHKLKRGYDIRLAGKAEKVIVEAEKSNYFASQPFDFLGLKPRLEVEEGAAVKIGSLLYSDKARPEIKFLSPASGKVLQINRGERRKIAEVVIESDGTDRAIDFGSHDEKSLDNLSDDQVKHKLLDGGLWPVIRQRPFSKIANPTVIPRDIFITGMDTAPLVGDPEFIIQGDEKYFNAGLKAVKKLTKGKIFLTLNGARSEHLPFLVDAHGVEVHEFSGKHPAGNLSVHVHHIAPLKSGDIIWHINVADLSLIGELFLTGIYPTDRIICVVGSAVKPEARKYYKTRVGVRVQTLVNEGSLTQDHVRIITGNIFRGRKIPESGYMGFYNRTLTVIPESKERNLFGWLTPGLDQESFSRTFLSRYFPRKEYIKDTRLHGGKRAFIQTGDYEKVLPMDIYPAYLVKSIMAGEIEDMIGLGLLEVDDEDFALCTYICPSKIDFGDYIRRGLDMLEREG